MQSSFSSEAKLVEFHGNSIRSTQPRAAFINPNAARAHEAAQAFLAAARIYCDYRKTTPDSAGEMVLATQAGTWSADRIIGDLAELIDGTGTRPTAETPVFPRSIGPGLEDIAIAEGIPRAADAR